MVCVEALTLVVVAVIGGAALWASSVRGLLSPRDRAFVGGTGLGVLLTVVGVVMWTVMMGR